MKIKLVVNSFPTTSETFLFNLVVGLEQQGNTVTVCARSPKNDAEIYKDRLSLWSKKIEIIPFSVFSIFSWLIYILQKPSLFLKAFKKFGLKKGMSAFLEAFYLLKGQPDIIHFAFSGLAIKSMNAISLLTSNKSKLFVSCRGTAEKVKPIIEKDRGSQLNEMFAVVHRVHCVSKDMLTGLLPMGLPEQKTFVNYPSIDASRFQRSLRSDLHKPDTWNIVTTGRLHFQKGYIFALQAMRHLKDRGFNFTYHVMGEGPDRSMLLYAIHELNLQNEVILHGKVSSSVVLEQLNKADVFLLPSLYEGIANAALEAMAMEIPIVTTKSGGMAEVVVNRENGMLVERFNGTKLAEAIAELFEDNTLRQKIAQNGRKTIVDKFTLEQQIECFIKEYQKTLKS